MERTEFIRIRHYLDKSQSELARLLSVSPKAVQSFEQGWRSVPVSTERQLLFLLCLKKPHESRITPCWEVRDCPEEIRRVCPAWEFKPGCLCWFINGTYCSGRVEKRWQDKMRVCRECEVFQSVLPDIKN